MTKYEIVEDGKSRVAEIFALEESELERRLGSVECRASNTAVNLRDIDAQLGLAILRLTKIEKQLRAERVQASIKSRGLRRVRPWDL